MLLIRKQQMEMLERHMLHDFKRRLHSRLRIRFPELDDETLGSKMERAMESAEHFSIRRECDVARYAEIFCGSATPDGEEPFPKAALNLLYAYRVEAEDRLANLERWLAENRTEAGR